MKVRTHFHLAKLSLKNIKEKYPEKFSLKMFYLGTILADCCWLPYTNPHFYKKSNGYVEKKLDSLLNKKKFSAYDSLQFGIIIHYICDFCCHSHITGGIGNAVDHVVYERKIQKYLLNNISKMSEMIKTNVCHNTMEIKDMISRHVSKYKNGSHSFKWDIDNCIEICTNVCDSVFRAFNIKNQPALAYAKVDK